MDSVVYNETKLKDIKGAVLPNQIFGYNLVS